MNDSNLVQYTDGLYVQTNPYAQTDSNQDHSDSKGEGSWWSWSSWSPWVHNGLDVAGTAPLAGIFPDLLNGIIYLAEGQYIMAGVAGLQATPFLGQAVTAAKFGSKVASSVKTATKSADNKVEDVTRVRHYTNRKGSNGIEKDGSIKAQDNNRVYVEPANKKALNQRQAEDKYQLKQGRGRDYIETDVPSSMLEWINNPRYGTPELTIKGDLPLSNPEFFRRK